MQRVATSKKGAQQLLSDLELRVRRMQEQLSASAAPPAEPLDHVTRRATLNEQRKRFSKSGQHMRQLLLRRGSSMQQLAAAAASSEPAAHVQAAPSGPPGGGSLLARVAGKPLGPSRADSTLAGRASLSPMPPPTATVSGTRDPTVEAEEQLLASVAMQVQQELLAEEAGGARACCSCGEMMASELLGQHEPECLRRREEEGSSGEDGEARRAELHSREAARRWIQERTLGEVASAGGGESGMDTEKCPGCGLMVRRAHDHAWHAIPPI